MNGNINGNEEIHIYFDEDGMHCEMSGNPNALLNMLASATASIMKHVEKDNRIQKTKSTPQIVAEFGKAILEKYIGEQEKDLNEEE